MSNYYTSYFPEYEYLDSTLTGNQYYGTNYEINNYTVPANSNPIWKQKFQGKHTINEKSMKFQQNSFAPRGQNDDFALKFYDHLKEVNKSEIDYSNLEKAKFFVIKSTQEDDVFMAVKYRIWSSTFNGNNILKKAYEESEVSSQPVFLFFNVNGSRHFTGVAQMKSNYIEGESSEHWKNSEKWKGIFKIEWIFLKDIFNKEFIYLNFIHNDQDYRSVIYSRDCQEIPFEIGKKMLLFFQNFQHKTSILYAFEDYDLKERTKKISGNSKITHPQSKFPFNRSIFRGRRGRYSKMVDNL